MELRGRPRQFGEWHWRPGRFPLRVAVVGIDEVRVVLTDVQDKLDVLFGEASHRGRLR